MDTRKTVRGRRSTSSSRNVQTSSPMSPSTMYSSKKEIRPMPSSSSMDTDNRVNSSIDECDLPLKSNRRLPRSWQQVVRQGSRGWQRHLEWNYLTSTIDSIREVPPLPLHDLHGSDEMANDTFLVGEFFY
ncbi:hypothetical protein PFISCL1PPCAC_20644 [Pristionchus fissidentatus]|uniref:Uncharacterized protein n=1 Tax=Pristionchus fissidentatus TaxID=1538716 RepID=A0AAV5WBW5_9BILA|nr:hypothetical protein PFISCL1PPCAC_20644 [Pristionchus fissidentatus]